MRIAEGEISEQGYKESKKGGNWVVFVFFALIFILFLLAQKYGKGGDDDWENYDRNGKHHGGRSAWPWIFLGGSGFGGRSGGGAGFGGFGGGGFSGGGAGGSW